MNQPFGGISSLDDLRLNLKENCVPESLAKMDDTNYLDYLDFLKIRRKLMAEYIRDYYYLLG